MTHETLMRRIAQAAATVLTFAIFVGCVVLAVWLCSVLYGVVTG